MRMRKFTARGAAPPVVVEMGHPVGTACLCRRAFRGQGGSKPADSETGGGGNQAALLSNSEKAGAQKGLPKPLGVALFLVWAVLLLVLWAWADLPGAPRRFRYFTLCITALHLTRPGVLVADGKVLHIVEH